MTFTWMDGAIGLTGAAASAQAIGMAQRNLALVIVSVGLAVLAVAALLLDGRSRARRRSA